MLVNADSAKFVQMKNLLRVEPWHYGVDHWITYRKFSGSYQSIYLSDVNAYHPGTNDPVLYCASYNKLTIKCQRVIKKCGKFETSLLFQTVSVLDHGQLSILLTSQSVCN